MTDRRSLELFAIWGGFFGGTIIWILRGVSGVPLSITRAVFMFAATVFTFGAVVRALRLTQPRDSSHGADRLRGGPDAPGGARRDAAGGMMAESRVAIETLAELSEYAFEGDSDESLMGHLLDMRDGDWTALHRG